MLAIVYILEIKDPMFIDRDVVNMWIKCADELPNTMDLVIAFADNVVCVCLWTGLCWNYFCECFDRSSPMKVTHWRYLPSAPEDMEI